MPSKSHPIYLDYNATTPLDPRVFDAMKPWFLEEPGNAGSRTHIYGQRAKDAVENARSEIATLIGSKPEEIIFTSGATESNNIAILGLSEAAIGAGRMHIIASAIEHKALLEPLEVMRKNGFHVELIPATMGGYVEPDEIRRRIRPETFLVSIMHSNNETGVMQPVAEISEQCAKSGVLFHTDAAQTFGKEVEEIKKLRCDLMSISSHKIYGPKGIGVLYVKRRQGEKRFLQALLHGGGQEKGLRPGTLPVPLIVGLGEAAKLAGKECNQRQVAAAIVKKQIIADLGNAEYKINGDPTRSQSHVVNLCFPGVDSEALMLALRDEMAFSNGSACTSTSYEPSHVLLAMGLSADDAECSVRLSWGQGVEKISIQSLISKLQELR